MGGGGGCSSKNAAKNVTNIMKITTIFVLERGEQNAITNRGQSLKNIHCFFAQTDYKSFPVKLV